MRKQAIQTAAHDVATQIRLVENQIESALSEIAELQSRMIHARSVANVHTGMGHEALQQVVAAISGLVDARGGLANAHQILKDTTLSVPGLREMSYGDGEATPPPTGFTERDLRIVA